MQVPWNLEVVRVGDLVDLPIGVDDPTILSWCEENERILVTFDRSTMPSHLQDHLNANRHSPGIFMLSSSSQLQDVLEFLIAASYASEPYEWRDWIMYL